MTNDPFPYFEYLTQTQLGQLYGVNAQTIGRWLVEVGVRRSNGQPTEQALRGGLANAIEDGKTKFHGWHKESMIELFQHAGKPLKSCEASKKPDPLFRGPFTYRRSSQEGDGYEIVGGDGAVSVWTPGEAKAKKLTWLLTLADEYGKLN